MQTEHVTTLRGLVIFNSHGCFNKLMPYLFVLMLLFAVLVVFYTPEATSHSNGW